MTTFEHAMVGINATLAVGLHRRHGWQIVALAGVAAILPDWDALTILFGASLFAEGHRLWGHNLLVAGLVAAIFSGLAYQFDAPTKCQRWLARRWDALAIPSQTEIPKRRASEFWLWVLVGVLATYSHLLMDMLVSAHRDLPVWGIPLFWPFTDTAWAYPLVPWGNVGPTVILAATMFAMLRWRQSVKSIAAGSLITLAVYMVVCGRFCN